MSHMRRRQVAFVLMAGFPFAFLVAFALYPLVQQGIGSVESWHRLKPSAFVGFQNYAELFAAPIAGTAAFHTVEYLVLVVPLEVALGLSGAWMTLQVRRGRGLLVTLFAVPLVVPWPAATTLFTALFAAHDPTFWSLNPVGAFASIVLIGIWKGTPWCYLLLLAALSTTSVELFEAARVDGARARFFWMHIVLPLVRPMLVFVIVLRVLAEAQTYTSVALLTQGGPYYSTQLASYYGYQLAFTSFEWGVACAMGTLLGAALLLVAIFGWLFSTPRKTAVYRPVVLVSLAMRARSRWWSLTESLQRSWQSHSVHLTKRWAGKPSRSASRSAVWGRLGRGGLLTVMGLFVLAPFTKGLPAGSEFRFFGAEWNSISSGVWNSMLVTVATLVGTFMLALPAAYVLARKKFPGRGALFLLVLFALAIPGVILLLPQYQEIAWLGLINTRFGLVVLYVAANVPLAVFFLRPAFASVPEPLVESMRVEGMSGLGIFRRLVVPLSSSTIIAVSVFVIVAVWNELPLAATLLNSQPLFTLPVLIAFGFGGSLGTWVSLAPPLVLLLATQRRFRSGVVSGGLL